MVRPAGLAWVLVLALACSSDDVHVDDGDGTSSESETGEEPACGLGDFRISLTGPFGTQSPTDAPLVQALSYGGPGRGTTCPCGSDCTNMPVDLFEFDMFGLASLPDCFTIEYAMRAGEYEGAWLVFRNANEGSAGEFVLAAGTDPFTVPPSMAGFVLEEIGSMTCSGSYPSTPKRIRYSWGLTSVDLDNGESGQLETPMGSMTVYNMSSGVPFEGLERWGWLMVPVGTFDG